MTSLIDGIRLRDEIRGTYWVPKPLHMSTLAVLTLSLQARPIIPVDGYMPAGFVVEHVSGTRNTFAAKHPGVIELFRALDRIYDELLRNPIELDLPSQEVLYANLWDLYE